MRGCTHTTRLLKKTKNARLTQTVGRLPASVALAVVAVTGVTGAHHPPKMVGALLFTGGAGAHIIICRKESGYFTHVNTKTDGGTDRRKESRIKNNYKQFIYIQISPPTFRNTLAQHKLEALATFLSANKSDRRSCDISCRIKKILRFQQLWKKPDKNQNSRLREAFRVTSKLQNPPQVHAGQSCGMLGNRIIDRQRDLQGLYGNKNAAGDVLHCLLWGLFMHFS